MNEYSKSKIKKMLVTYLMKYFRALITIKSEMICPLFKILKKVINAVIIATNQIKD